MLEIELNMNQSAQHYLDAVIKKARGLFCQKDILGTHAFQQLLEPLEDNLYNFIFKALYFSEDANDVYQDTVLRAFKYRHTYQPGLPFKTWLFTIAGNEIKAYFNRHKKNRAVALADEHTLIPQDMDPERSAMVQAVYNAAQLMGEKQRTVFFLFYDHGFSIKEIKEITGLKEGNIKFILNHCRETIKEKLNLQKEVRT